MDKLRSIEFFMRVAEKRSIAAAAELLEVSPPTVSRVIATLEDELGFELFHRTTRRLSLTVNGGMYLERCRHILQDLEEAELAGKQQRKTLSGTVKVAMHPAFRAVFFVELARFFEEYPLLRVETKIGNSPAVLFDEGFDLLIRAGEPVDSTLVARRIGWLEVVLVASPRYLSEYGEPKTPADLKNHRWALPTRSDNLLGSSVSWEFFRKGKRHSVVVSSYVTMRDSIGFHEALIGGAAIGGVYTVAIMRSVRDGLLKRILADWRIYGRPAYAVFPNSRGITPKTLAVVDLFSELVAEAEKQFPRH